MSCGSNPCNVTVSNSAACESVPSQITNFTLQFFGEVTKTEVDGVVTWTLPCDLNVGLPNNPRLTDEGLACYFLRLFEEGIIGLTGPTGATGEAGDNGRDAFTILLTSFEQPTLSNPNINVVSYYNPIIQAGLYVFITGSGWYLVNTADTNGSLSLTLVKALSSVSGTVTSGKFIVPSGFPGSSVVGPTGPQGPTGPTGPQGDTYSTTNGFFYAPSGTDFPVAATFGAVTFTAYTPSVILPTAGKYKITAVVGFKAVGAVATSDELQVKLRDDTASSDVPGSLSPPMNGYAANVNDSVVMDVIYTSSADNTSISLYADATAGSVFEILYASTTITFVRIE